MDILISPEIIAMYFNTRGKIPKSEVEQLVHLSIDNENNHLLINKSLVEKYEDKLKGSPQLLSLYQPLIQYIMDNRSIRLSSNEQNGLNSILKDLEKQYLDDESKQKSIVYSNVAGETKNSLDNEYSAIVERYKPKNYDWLLFQLAAYNPKTITFRYFDFSSDDEIADLFEFLFKITERCVFIDIFDRQTNLDHDIFDPILSSRRINYYTVYERDSVRRTEQIQDIKDKFRRVKIYTVKSSEIHERRILIRDLLIETDNDFWNLEFDKSTWKIDITLCRETASEISRKKNKFRAV